MPSILASLLSIVTISSFTLPHRIPDIKAALLTDPIKVTNPIIRVTIT
jgi:hypothetical protein